MVDEVRLNDDDRDVLVALTEAVNHLQDEIVHMRNAQTAAPDTDAVRRAKADDELRTEMARTLRLICGALTPRDGII